MGLVRDPVYGSVPITQKEQGLLATRKLQRLRRIKQLGLAHLIYPGANHSRFEHLVGAMHITSILLQEFERRDEARITDDNKQTIRIAALLHDLGHGPFSHTFDELAKSEVAGAGMDHERMTKKIIASDREVAGLLGRKVGPIIRFLNGGYIGDIPGEVITGELGTDRMDYLIRDTYYTGLGHRPDIHSLVSSVRLVGERKRRIAVSHDELSGVELLSTTRYYHYGMIAHSKECRPFELLLLKAIAAHLGSMHVLDRMKFIKRAFSYFDDTDLLVALRSRRNKFMQNLDEDRALQTLYRIRLCEIRWAISKYCLYRLSYSHEGRRDYCRRMTRLLSSRLRLRQDDIFVDLDLWKHDVSDVISHRKTYETESEKFSALLCDESPVLRDIAGAQALSSTLSVYAMPTLRSRLSALRQIVEEQRRTLLGEDQLIPFTRQLIREHGPCQCDEVFILLHSLNDFYTKLTEEERLQRSGEIPYLRGITRLTEIAAHCQRRIGSPNAGIKTYWPRASKKPFKYSPEMFSIINALHHLGIVELVYAPDVDRERMYAHTYFIRVKERIIRNSIFEGIPAFISLRNDYLRTFRSRALASVFERAYADKDRKVIGGPSSRANPD